MILSVRSNIDFIALKSMGQGINIETPSVCKTDRQVSKQTDKQTDRRTYPPTKNIQKNVLKLRISLIQEIDRDFEKV